MVDTYVWIHVAINETGTSTGPHHSPHSKNPAQMNVFLSKDDASNVRDDRSVSNVQARFFMFATSEVRLDHAFVVCVPILQWGFDLALTCPDNPTGPRF